VTTFAAVFRSVVSYKINYFRRARFVDMVGVTGSIPVAPTTQSGYPALCGDLRPWPAIGGLLCSQLAVSLFLSAH
jgi:hypothetical protein